MNTPMHPTIYLGLDEESMQVDGTQNRAMIRSLLYLTASRPDIMFSACLCEVFKKKPREVHLIVVKRIFRFLIGTSNLGFCFKKKNDFKLIGYCDVDPCFLHIQVTTNKMVVSTGALSFKFVSSIINITISYQFEFLDTLLYLNLFIYFSDILPTIGHTSSKMGSFCSWTTSVFIPGMIKYL